MNESNSKGIFGRAVLLVAGTCIIAMGIATFAKASIGMSPLSCCPYVLSNLITQVSLGKWVLLWNAIFALLQIPVLGKKYKLYLLLQIPLAVVLGTATDVVNMFLSGISADTYFMQISFAVTATVVTAIGVYMTVQANLIMNGPEAFLNSVSERFNWKFGTLRVIFDISNVVLGAVIGFTCLHHIIGIREGTILSAVFTGIMINIIARIHKGIISRHGHEE